VKRRQTTPRIALVASSLVALASACSDEPGALQIPGSSVVAVTTGPGGAVGGAGGEASSGVDVGGTGGAAVEPLEPAGPCSSEGGQSCGGNGIGGATTTLYVCKGGQYVVDHACGEPCEAMPAGVPDRCPGDVVVPPALVGTLSVKPYVEGACKPATWPGWPYEAKTCSYSASGFSATVTVANPSAERVAAWIADASVFIPALWRLRTTAPDAYEDGLVATAKHTLGQSSTIFPLEGGVIENMGGGAVNYPFSSGVTEGCSGGCYCRINSLHRTTWCSYVAFLGEQTYDACIGEVGSMGHTKGWTGQCLQNHIDAWTAGSNAHYRAAAWKANAEVKTICNASKPCTPSEVVAAVVVAYD